MAGSLVVGDINSVDVESIQKQVATAWVRFDSEPTVAIDEAYNVSSITDNDIGDFTVNFETAMTSSIYGVVGTTGAMRRMVTTATTNTISGVQINCARTDISERVDVDLLTVLIFGGKS